MKKLLISIIMIIVAMSSIVVLAESQSAYPFKSPQKAKQFQTLTYQLRCLVCQNENIADSNASLAKDLRGEVYNMVKAGKSSGYIKNYMVERYGDFVLFKPPVNYLTLLLWFGPAILLLLAFCILMLTLRSLKQKKLQALSVDELAKLQSVLGEEE